MRIGVKDTTSAWVRKMPQAHSKSMLPFTDQHQEVVTEFISRALENKKGCQSIPPHEVSSLQSLQRPRYEPRTYF
jgi:hypothetical protein